MKLLLTYMILLLAAMLEAGGDALVRAGLHHHALAVRVGLFSAGAAVLLAYGFCVNAPAWDFGKLLGVYVTLFFVVAQVIDYAAFRVRPDLPIVVGGALVVAGGLVITLWRAAPTAVSS